MNLCVPTQRKEISLLRTAYSESEVACRRFAAWLSEMRSSHARLDDGTTAGLHRVDFRTAKVDADYVVTLVREAGCGDSADIAEPEYADRCTHADTLFPSGSQLFATQATVCIAIQFNLRKIRTRNPSAPGRSTLGMRNSCIFIGIRANLGHRELKLEVRILQRPATRVGSTHSYPPNQSTGSI